ncbi:MAG: SH3 domain-containing protein [Thiobacillus sp.]
MKPTPPLWLMLGASLIALSAHAAPGTLLRDESLRSQPSATAPVAAQVGRGTSVDIVARRGGWLQVKTGRTQGWVRLLSVRAGQGGSGRAGVGDVLGVATRRADPSRVVSVAGVRGLNEDQLRQARFDADELSRLDSFAATLSQGRSHANKSGLASVNVPSLPRPQSAYGPANNNNAPSSWEN